MRVAPINDRYSLGGPPVQKLLSYLVVSTGRLLSYLVLSTAATAAPAPRRGLDDGVQGNIAPYA